MRRAPTLCFATAIGLSLVPALVAQAERPSPEKAASRWALLIGIDDYSELHPLHYADHDQQAMAEQLIASGFPQDQVFLLHDKAQQKKYLPFRANIEQQLDLVLSLANEGDLLVVGFSGHGAHIGDRDYLCPVDTQIRKMAQTAIPLPSIYEKLGKSKATLKLLVVDACRSDFLPEGVRAAANVSSFAVATEKPPEGIMLLSSCGVGQFSREDQQFGHGVFMHFLLEGLAGQAADNEGTIALAGLYNYASLQTKKYVARTFNDYQTPALKGEINGPFELGKVRTVKTITNSLGMKLVLIPAGEFTMGNRHTAEDEAKAFQPYGLAFSAGAFDMEYPPHRVRITQPFYLGAYHVTRGQFRQFVEATHYRTDAEKDSNGSSGYISDGAFEQKPQFNWRNPGFAQTDEHPVVEVSWNDANAFCEWLSRKEAVTYRLPTEAQWEYACRAGTTTRYYSGDDPETLTQVANVADATAKAQFPDSKHTINGSDGYPFTAPVGQFRPNAFGLYDMHGNACQWCSDRYGAAYYATSPSDDPDGPAAGTWRVLRGGAWTYPPHYVRSANRGGFLPSRHNAITGFRVARTQG